MKSPATLTITGEIHRPDLSGAVCRIDVPSAVVMTTFGRKGRVPVVATFPNGGSVRTALIPMRGTHILPVTAEVRGIAAVAEGVHVEVSLREDTAERTVDVAPDLAAELRAAGVRDVFDRMSYSHRKEWARALDDAKRPETRAKRLAQCVEAMRQRAGTGSRSDAADVAARIRAEPRIDAMSDQVTILVRAGRR